MVESPLTAESDSPSPYRLCGACGIQFFPRKSTQRWCTASCAQSNRAVVARRTDPELKARRDSKPR